MALSSSSSSYHPWTRGAGTFNSGCLEKVGKSGSTKKLVWGLILFPLLCILLFRLYVVSPHHYRTLQLPRPPISLSEWSGGEGSQGKAHMGSPLTRLVRGAARQQLARTGIVCVYDPLSNFCVTTAAVAITTGPHRSPTVYLTGGQQLPAAEGPNGTTGMLQIQPYPRKTDRVVMDITAPVSIVDSAGRATLRCDVVHSVPAVVFSTGGYAGNFFHDVSELLIPLFLTAGGMRSRVRLVVTDYMPYWVSKYRRVIAYLSGVPTGVVPASPHIRVPGAVTGEAVHCFPAAVVGLKYHDNLACNASLPPGGATTTDFKAFLRGAFGLNNARVPVVANGTSTGGQPPLLVLLSRRRSRALLNEDQVVAAAKEAGFRVEVALPKHITDLERGAELINSCSVLMGVHGAGMTNMVFLPDGAVVLQIVPLGLDWPARTCYGREPAARLGLRYLEYTSPAEESTLYQKYPKDHPVIADPDSVGRQGFYVSSKPLYFDGQNITVDVFRLKGTLLQAMELLHHPLQ